MKFLFTVTDFDIGGITTSLKNLTDELIRRGHKVAIMNLPGNIDFPVQFHVDVEMIQVTGKAKYWNIGIEDFQRTSRIKKIILLPVGLFKKGLNRLGLWEKFIFSSTPVMECDVAIAYRQSSICYYLIKHKSTAKHTMAFIHSEFDGDCSSWLSPLKEIDHIVCVSNAWSDMFRQRFPYLAAKVTTVYNMFDPLLLIKRASEYTQKYEDNVFKIVTISRIDNSTKKIDNVPYICKRLRELTKKKFCWYIIGDGPDRENVECIIRDTNMGEYVKLLGAMKNPLPYLKTADLFVMTSHMESFGMVIQEALILGTPVVAADYPALHEIIKDGENGLITKNSVDGVADGVYRMMTDHTLYRRLKQNAIEFQYSLDTAYNQLMSICRRGMEGMTKYSIIVPVYNASKHLRRCIKSLKAQTYTDFEVILVDDCSTDDSYQICKHAAKSDNRFIVIRQKRNHRQPAARNLGLQKAKGEYVLFVDSDDYIENDMLSNIDVVLSEYSYDLITWGMYNNVVKSNGHIIIEENPLNVKKDTYVKMPTSENWLMLWMDTFFASVCNKLYKRHIINKHSIIFDEVCVDFEDYLFNVKYCKCVNSFVAISKPYYHYRQPEGQIPALKRQWKQVKPFQVSNLVFRETKELIAQYTREENALDDTMLYVYKAYMNELEYHYRTKRIMEYVRVVKVLSRDTSFAEMLAHIHQPALQKIVLPLKFFIRMKLGKTLALFLWLTEWKEFRRKGRII